MKKAILYSALALGSLSMTSCGDSFLELDPVGAVSESTLTSDEGIDYVLNAAYNTFYGIKTHVWTMGNTSMTGWVYGDIMGADANKGSTATDQSDLTALETWAIVSSNSYLTEEWNAIYESVKRCNNVIDMAEKMGDALQNKEQVIAQARFIKGVWMFEGIRIFGAAIPYVTLEAYQASTDPQVGNLDESGNYVYVWDKVEEDLKYAVENLPETWSDSEKARATSWQAKAVLAKLYLYWSSPYNGTNGTEDHWTECRELLNEIISSGKNAQGTKYRLVDNYADLFDVETSDWNGEDVFDIQTTISGTQIFTSAVVSAYSISQAGASGIGGWGFYQPTYEFVNSFIVDENGLPDASYRSKAALTQMVNGTIVSDLETYTDPRLDVCAGRFGVPFLDYGVPSQAAITGWVRDYTNGGLYMNKKPEPKKSDRPSYASATYPGSTAKNYHIIRYADILLMRAEVAIHDGDLATALQYINQVRKRAANSAYTTAGNESYYTDADLTVPEDYTFQDKVNNRTVTNTVANYRLGLYTSFANATEATTALKRELRAEFGMEGHRWFDLARWGEVADVLNNEFKAYEVQYLSKYSNVYGANWVTLPIPETEIITAAGRFKQNVNWQ